MTNSHSGQPSLFIEPKARKAWVEACEFHPLTNAEVLRQVEKETRETNLKPTVLLDLDSTLYEVGPRTYQILKEWVASVESSAFAKVREVVAQLKHEHVGYSMIDTFGALGLSHTDATIADAVKSAYQFWGKRFFTNEYLAHDQVYEGAAEFARKLHDAGAELIYLTGRDEPGMGKGTRDRLRQDGFPWEKERTHLLLKKNFHLDDLEHKAGAAEYVKQTGHLVASFENEPPNLVALSDIFPQSMHVFMDTVYSEKPAMPKKGLYRITAFV